MRALLVLPVAAAEAAADLLALAGVAADVVPVDGVGAVAVLAGPGRAQDAAARASRALPRAQAVLLEVADDRVTASRWSAGRQLDAPAAGLLLATWPDAVSRLALGTHAAADQPGAVSSAGRSRWRAARSLLGGAGRDRRR